MPNILAVANCPSENTTRLLDALVSGIQQVKCDDLVCRRRTPLEATAEDVLWADGIVLGTTENFGYMSGLIKDFLERIYYPCLEQTQGLPFGFYVKGGLDGQGAKTSVERIVTGLRWKSICSPVILKGDFCADFESQCKELGQRMAAGLDAGIY